MAMTIWWLAALLSLRLNGGSFPKPLSAEEERACLEQAARGDLAARNRLIEHNLRLVSHVMKKYYTQSAEQDDLLSIGTIGLIKGIESFRPEKGARLATYAARCVENEILMHFRSGRKSAGEVSLSEMLESAGDGTALSLMDVVCSDEDLFEDYASRELQGMLRGMMARCLSAQERQVLTLRFGLAGGEPMTQRDAAARCGVSRSYVSRIEKRALEKLRCEIER